MNLYPRILLGPWTIPCHTGGGPSQNAPDWTRITMVCQYYEQGFCFLTVISFGANDFRTTLSAS